MERLRADCEIEICFAALVKCLIFASFIKICRNIINLFSKIFEESEKYRKEILEKMKKNS